MESRPGPFSVESGFVLPIGGHYVCTPAWTQRTDIYADAHRCYFPRRGGAEFTVGGRTIELRPGRVYLIPGYQPLRYACAQRLELDWLHFRALAPDQDAALAAVRLPVIWPARAWAFWRPVYRRLNELSGRPSAQLLQQVGAMLQYFVAQVLAGQAGVLDPQTSTWAQRLEPALAFMNGHYLESPPLAAIAAQVHLAPTYFHAQFRRVFRVTPHDYMLRRRMRHAQGLLRTTGLRVSEIARQAGYPNVFYFSRVFRSHFGCSPGQARLRQCLDGP